MDGLSGELVQAFFEDREGNLWVATSKGIDMFHDLRVSSFSTHEGLSIDSADSVLASRDGPIWIGNAGHLEVLGPSGVSSQPGKALPGHQVTSLLEDHAGRLWVGIDNTLSIYQRGKFSQIKKQDGSPLGMIMGLTEDSENNIWVETHGPPVMLIRIQNLKVREEFAAPPMPPARKLVADPQSGIWLGLVNGDLARFRSGKTEIFPFAGHPDSRVLALTASSDGSILGATAFGVIGWKNGKQQILTVRNGLPCDGIDALISDNQGDLWLHAECGLIEIANDEVQRWWGRPESRLKVRVFDASDGVQTGVGHFNTSARTQDGRLWFANGTLLQMIDPAHMAGNTVAPPVHVDLIVADRKSYSPQEVLSLPPLTRDLEIDYTALSFVLPQKVFFRYMLDGRDTRWEEPGTRRQAFYNDLPPGHYRFRVIACNNDGVWNEVGATLEFNILPAFYQTKWFVLFCVAATACLAWMAYRYRVRQVTGRLDMQFRERLSERSRIARELHDTLLQSFQGLVLNFQRARNLLPDRSVEAIQTLDKALDGAEQAIVEGRDAIHDLRSLAPAAQGLAEEITALGEELIAEDTNKDPAQFRVVIEGSAQVLHPNVHVEIYRIAREALRNAVIHSQARLIETEIAYSDKLFRLRIRDDGKGLDPNLRDQGERTGHWGLRGMRERAQRLGGELDIWSEPGAGTEVELRIPSSMVYEASPARNGVRLFWKKMKNDHERPS
jgi:signal transduction histidine kinase